MEIPCKHSLKFGTMLLTCNLWVTPHKIHHDPSGLWWAECTLPDCSLQHTEGR